MLSFTGELSFRRRRRRSLARSLVFHAVADQSVLSK